MILPGSPAASTSGCPESQSGSGGVRSSQRPMDGTRRFGCRLKLYPTVAQAERFAVWARAGSGLRDLLLERDQACFEETRGHLSLNALRDVTYEFAEGHPGLDWPAHSRNQHARDHAVAVRLAFRRLKAGKRGRNVGWPVPRRSRPTTIYVHNQTLKVSGTYVRLSRARHGWTRYRGTIPAGRILSGRIRHDDTAWTLSLSMEAPVPVHVAPRRSACRVTLSPGSIVMADNRRTRSYSDIASSTTDDRRLARLRRRVARRSWRCTECGNLMRSDRRSGLLAGDKRQAPCGHWIVDYEKTARLRQAETAVRKLTLKNRNRLKDEIHNVTASLVRNYGQIGVDVRAGRGTATVDFLHQIAYKGSWYGREVTLRGTAAQAETGPEANGANGRGDLA